MHNTAQHWLTYAHERPPFSSFFPSRVDQGKALLDPYITLMESATIIAEEYPLVFPPGTNFAYTGECKD